MDIQSERKTEIENKVIEVFESIGYDYKNKDKIDIIYIAKKLGFKIGSALLNEDEDGFIIVQEGRNEILGIKTDKLIDVNANRELKWKRFIIAHELAHFVLHYDPTKSSGIFAQREHVTGKGKSENEADYFAANILMPKENFVAEYNKLTESGCSANERKNKLSDIFTVTDLMVSRRIKELALE